MQNEILSNRLKLHRLLKNYYKRSNKETILNIAEKIKEDKNKHFLSFDTKGNITYAKNYDKRYNDNNRVKTSIGRYIRRQLGVTVKELSDTEMSNFSDFVSQQIKTNGINDKVTILSGKALKDAYAGFSGGVGSCMTGKHRSNYINLYADNPDKVKLIVTKDKRGRALLFVDDNGNKVLSRCYGRYNDIMTWCKVNKIGNGSIKTRITLKCKKAVFPSIDIFYNAQLEDLNIKKNRKCNCKVILSKDKSFGNVYMYSTSGWFVPKPVCYFCNKIIDYYYNRYTFDGKSCCNNCYKKHLERCCTCNLYLKKEDFIDTGDRLGGVLKSIKICKKCASASKKNYCCVNCKKKVSPHQCIFIQDPCMRYNYQYKYLCFKCIGLTS